MNFHAVEIRWDKPDDAAIVAISLSKHHCEVMASADIKANGLQCSITYKIPSRMKMDIESRLRRAEIVISRHGIEVECEDRWEDS